MPPHTAHHHHTVSRYGAPNAGAARTRDGAKAVNPRDLEVLPSMDNRTWYDPPSPSSSSTSDDSISAPPFNLLSNSRNKLQPSARYMRKGKMYAWGPSFEDVNSDQRVRKRLKLCLEQFLPEAAAEVGAVPPPNIAQSEAKRKSRKRRKVEDEAFVLPHLASPSPPMSTMKLAPTLALPQTYTDILLSASMRHSLGDDSMETGLQRTAGELLEGEKGLMQALGRLREVLRLRGRDVPQHAAVEPPAPSNPVVANGNHLGLNGHLDTVPQLDSPARSPAPSGGQQLIPALPHISDTDNLWRVTQELLQAQPQPTITFTSTPPGAAISAPPPIEAPRQLTAVHRLFTCPTGITVNAIPQPNHAGYQYPPSHPAYPQHVKYNLDLPTQCRAVDDALERIAELLADCNEYKERLEEARDRVADVARARKKVWGVIKDRAGYELDKEGV